jgi:hypothetical protein
MGHVTSDSQSAITAKRDGITYHCVVRRSQFRVRILRLKFFSRRVLNYSNNLFPDTRLYVRLPHSPDLNPANVLLQNFIKDVYIMEVQDEGHLVSCDRYTSCQGLHSTSSRGVHMEVNLRSSCKKACVSDSCSIKCKKMFTCL